MRSNSQSVRPSARWRGCCATAVRRPVYPCPGTALAVPSDGGAARSGPTAGENTGLPDAFGHGWASVSRARVLDRYTYGMTRRSIVMLLALAAIWGASFMFIKVAVRALDPLALVWLRVVLAAIVLVPIALAVAGRRGIDQAWAAKARLPALGLLTSAR